MQEPTLVINTEGITPSLAPQYDPTDIVNIDTTAHMVKKGKLLTVYGDGPVLSTISAPFNFEHPQTDPIELAESLHMTMKKYGGVGLAAIQCNIPLRVIVLDCDIVCFNPRIIAVSDEPSREKEGCLSFPGLFIPVTRPMEVNLTWQDAKGIQYEQTFTGLTARVILHELDHLDGIVFTQHVGNLTLQMAKKKKQKMMKKIQRHLNRQMSMR